MKEKKLKPNWNNIIRYASGLVIIATIITLVIVSCQHTEAVEEEPTETTTEMQLDCFKYIEDIPLPTEFQTYINKVAKSYEIAPEIVFAMIERESAYDTTEVGDNGDSEGLMQIQRQHHEERMKRLGVTDLFDPYDNVLVGVDYLAELLEQYGDMGMALTAYNAGPSGADEYYFSNGIYANEYAEAVLEQSEIFDEGAILVFYRTDDPVAEPIRIGDIGSNSQAHRVYSCDGKSVTLSANGGGQGGKTGLYACPSTKGKPIYEVRNGFITIKGKQYPIKLADGFYIIRKLTVTECKRLQTVPDAYEFPVSDSQAYKMLGNGWTIEVIAHLINSCLSDKGDVQPKNEQMKFF